MQLPILIQCKQIEFAIKIRSQGRLSINKNLIIYPNMQKKEKLSFKQMSEN
jgi:hypothetical protein